MIDRDTSPEAPIRASVDDVVSALGRIAVALERLAVAGDRGGGALAPLPAVRAVTVVQPEPEAAACAVHHAPWRVIPAGVSRRTGAAYEAFRVCSVDGCRQRPT